MPGLGAPWTFMEASQMAEGARLLNVEVAGESKLGAVGGYIPQHADALLVFFHVLVIRSTHVPRSQTEITKKRRQPLMHLFYRTLIATRKFYVQTAGSTQNRKW